MKIACFFRLCGSRVPIKIGCVTDRFGWYEPCVSIWQNAMKSHCLINPLKSRKPIQTHLKTTCRSIVFRCSAWQKTIFWNDIRHFEWKTPSRFDHFQTQCFYKKNTLQKTSKRHGVLHSKLHFCVQSFQKVLIFDTRAPLNVRPKPLSIFLIISTPPQTIWFRSPNAPN